MRKLRKIVSETTALENLKYAHAYDVALDLPSQDVHELWAEVEARDKCIAELKEYIGQLIEASKKIYSWASFEDYTAFYALVDAWKERE